MMWEPFESRDGAWYQWRIAGAEVFVCRQGGLWRGLCRPLGWNKRRRERSAAAAPRGRAAQPKDPPRSCWAGPLETAAPDPAAFPGGTAFSAVWEGGPPNGDSPAGLAETAGAGSPPRAALRPVFPEKPFLVNLPDRPRLFPGVELPLNLELPPLLKLTVFPPPALPGEPPGEPASAGAAVSGETLFTFTPFPLNETWYGDTTMKGVLCLSLSVSAGEGADPEGALVRCGALIQNRTKAILELSQFPLYAGELSIYQKEGALVTDTPVLDASENGNFRVSLRSPGGVLVAEGNKNGVGDLLIQRGSRIIKNITGL